MGQADMDVCKVKSSQAHVRQSQIMSKIVLVHIKSRWTESKSFTLT